MPLFIWLPLSVSVVVAVMGVIAHRIWGVTRKDRPPASLPTPKLTEPPEDKDHHKKDDDHEKDDHDKKKEHASTAHSTHGHDSHGHGGDYFTKTVKLVFGVLKWGVAVVIVGSAVFLLYVYLNNGVVAKAALNAACPGTLDTIELTSGYPQPINDGHACHADLVSVDAGSIKIVDTQDIGHTVDTSTDLTKDFDFAGISWFATSRDASGKPYAAITVAFCPSNEVWVSKEKGCQKA